MKIRISQNEFEWMGLFLVYLTIFPIDSISIVNEWKIINLVLYYGFFIVAIIVIALFTIKRSHFSHLLIIFICMFLYYLLNTFLRDDSAYLAKIFKIYVSVFVIIIIVQFYSQNKPNLLISSAYFYFSIMIYLNFFFMLKYPEGLARVKAFRTGGIVAYNRCNFLGVDNRLIMWFLLQLILICLNNGKSLLKRVNDLLLLICMIFQMIMVWSATGILGMLTFFVCFCLLKFFKVKWLTTFRSLMTYIMLSIGIVFFQIQKYFSYYIERFLNKSVDLSKRDELWNAAISMIMESPFWGYGYSNNGTIIYGNLGYWYAHNLILDIFIQGGLFLMLIYLVVFLITIVKIGDDSYEYSVQICLIGFFSFLITAITESYLANVQFFFVLVLLYYSKELNGDSLSNGGHSYE